MVYSKRHTALIKMFAMCLLIFVVYAELIEVKILDIYVQSNFFMCNQFSERDRIAAIKARLMFNSLIVTSHFRKNVEVVADYNDAK